MKHKHKLIQQIKEKYGVPHLHFFKGYRDSSGKHHDFFSAGVICALDPQIKKKCKKRNSDLHIIVALTHTEIERVLADLSLNSKLLKRGKSPYYSVTLEPYGIEVSDLNSLKSTYLLLWLSGI